MRPRKPNIGWAGVRERAGQLPQRVRSSARRVVGVRPVRQGDQLIQFVFRKRVDPSSQFVY